MSTEPPRRDPGRALHAAGVLAIPTIALGATFLAVYVSLKGVTVVGRYADYGAVAIVAGLDSVCGGIRAGLEHRFSVRVFITGFFTNMVIAMLFTYGSRVLAVDLYLAVVVALGIRIFYNLGAIRHYTLDRRMLGPNERQEAVPGPLNPSAEKLDSRGH